ncbi:zinc finger BED domain-containing protein 4-like [Drosophila willistoni]|uniref:zinc finger BED domain-containing protein 4-like n=1 Tax=Drosophila willistoni TaxID=7260 RepID=UPI000C26CEA2|nr:zinc finger BED domain-containing protein 4-like [Drosophila willistoni]
MITAVGTETCSFLMNSVKKRLYPYENRSDPRLGTLLDARFKKEGFQNAGNAQQAALALEEELCSFKDYATKPNNEELPKENRSPFLFKFVEQKICDKVSNRRADAIVMLRQYMEQRNASHDTDPLQYWKINEHQLNALSRCALKFLSIPASSVESERIFSKAGAIITDRQSSLKAKHVNQIIFLNKNQWLEKYEH